MKASEVVLPVLRRLSLSMASTPSPSSNSVSKLIMDSNNFGVSRRLATLARQLRLYKPPPAFDDPDVEERRVEESAGKVVSQVGFVESATPISRQPERFRPPRAAVLICLFEGDDGDLRVILTKRSSMLSSHSGEVSLPGGKADEGDADDVETATREAKEEIGLDPSLVNVVAVLEPFLSKSNPSYSRMISRLTCCCCIKHEAKQLVEEIGALEFDDKSKDF